MLAQVFELLSLVDMTSISGEVTQGYITQFAGDITWGEMTMGQNDLLWAV